MLKSIALITTVGLVLSAAPAAAQTNAREVLDHVDDLWRSTSSHSEASMRVKTAHYERSMTMEVWSEGKDKSLIRILSPRKEKGTATLKSGKNMYTYLPKTDRTIRLTSGMMAGSWMGSHFTNDDLVKESRMADDYTYKVSFEGQRDGEKVIEITLLPKADAAVAWGKVVLTVRADDKVPTTQVYYDEDGHIARTMTFSDVVTMGGRLLPAKMTLTPADEPGEFTEIVYKKIEFGLTLRDSLFSKASLKRK